MKGTKVKKRGGRKKKAKNTILELKEIEARGNYQSAAPNRRAQMWKAHLKKEEEGKFCSMIKGIDMQYVNKIPLTDSMADHMNPEQFKDPFLVAENTFQLNPLSPQFERKSVFGHYSIKTRKDRENEQKTRKYM